MTRKKKNPSPKKFARREKQRRIAEIGRRCKLEFLQDLKRPVEDYQDLADAERHYQYL